MSHLDDGGLGGDLVGQAQGLHQGSDGLLGDAQDVLEGIVHGVHNAEQYEHVQDHGQTAGGGVVPILLLELHQLFILLFLVVLVLVLDLLHEGLENRQLGHGFLLVKLERHAGHPDENGKQDDGNAVVSHKGVDPFQDPAQGTAEDSENLHRQFLLLRLCARSGLFFM